MTTPHERDRSLEQWLSASLPVSAEPTDACLDAETAAAWVDGGLNSSARQLAETHLSTCARCQALVGSIVALETAANAAEAPAPAPWRAWLNWMVPLGALATAGLALAVWLNVPTRPVEQADITMQSRLESAADTAPSTAANAAAAKSAAAPAAAGANLERTDSPDRSPANTGTLAPPPPASQAPAAPGARSAEQRVDATAAADAAAPASGPQGVASGQAFAAREASGGDVASPDGQVRWRLSGSVVLRSADDGETWAPVVSGAPGRLRAGSAPSATVCWLVGDNGLVLRAVDGVTFVRVTAPDAGDLTVVTATSAASAVVSVADGRRFVTTDGGATWERIG